MKCLFFAIGMSLSILGYSQDPHFSQYFASPVTLNPANTGTFSGNMRVAANYRTQWWNVGAPFTTATISIEGLLLRNKIRQEDKLAFSIMALNDASSAGALKSTYLSAGLAYHLALDEYGENSIGIGFNAVYAQKRLDYGKLTFASQFMSGGFNQNVASGEAFAGANTYTNINAGGIFQRNTETEKAYFGVAAFNFLDEKLSFTKSGFVENVIMRYSVNGGYNKELDNNNAISVSGNFMYQSGAYEAIAGAAYSWLIPTGNTYQSNYFTAGAWYRFEDAIIPYVGLTWGDLKLGLSYDIVTNGVRLAAPKNGSFELSLIFTGQRSEKGVKCPTF